MRKLIFCMILLGLFIPIRADAQLTYGPSYYNQNRGMALSGVQNDPLLRFITEVDTDLQSVPTFANGGTFDNAVNNTFEWNENTDELIWTFGSNVVTVSSGDVTLFDFGTVKLGFDVFTVNSVDYTFPTADGTNTYQLTTDGAGTLSWEAPGAGASVTLDQAYDQGGAGIGRTITADTLPVLITNTDADAAFLLSVTPTPGSSAATGGISITSGGNSTEDSLQITNSGSGFSISSDSDAFTVANDGSVIALDADLTGAGGLVLQNDATITNAVDGAVKLAEGGESLILTLNSNTVTLSSDDAVDQVAFGAVDNLTGVDDIAFDATTTSGITKAASAGSADFTVAMSGSVDASLILSSAGTGSDALQVTTSAGGIVMTNGGAAGGEDFSLDAVLASLKLNADEDVEDAIDIITSAGGINITADGAANSDLDLACTNGSTNISGGEADAAAVAISAGAGGITLTSAATYDIDNTATGGKFIVTASENAGNTVHIEENGGSSGGINLYANQGEGVSATTEHDASIQLHTDAGGIGLYSTANLGNAVRIETNGGGSETIVVQSVQGTGASAATESDASIQLVSTVGGVGLRSSLNAVDAIRLETDGGTSETLILHSNQGQSATEGAASIQLLSDAGGINIKGNLNNADAVLLTADGGTSATIRIHNDQGEGTGSIAITSDAGGVTVDGGAAQDVVVTSTGAAVNLVSTQAALDAIKLNPSDADGGVDVSDSNMANVGDIYCDDLVTDGSSDVMWVLKTVVKTIDVDDDASTDDFQFDDDASNQTEQPVDLGAILPAYAEIVSAQIRCFETVTGSAQMAIDLLTQPKTSGSTQRPE
ncbi:MAG: beta strand repeat-containing protein [Planctomycetota bacterium]|jgi:hypothetical protein